MRIMCWDWKINGNTSYGIVSRDEFAYGSKVTLLIGKTKTKNCSCAWKSDKLWIEKKTIIIIKSTSKSERYFWNSFVGISSLKSIVNYFNVIAVNTFVFKTFEKPFGHFETIDRPWFIILPAFYFSLVKERVIVSF